MFNRKQLENIEETLDAHTGALAIIITAQEELKAMMIENRNQTMQNGAEIKKKRITISPDRKKRNKNLTKRDPYIRVSLEEREHMLELYDSGMSTHKIAQEMNRGSSTIGNHLRKILLEKGRKLNKNGVEI